jgi:hypothetical protein
MPSLPAPFFWTQYVDRQWGPWWAACGPEGGFATLRYVRAGWRLWVGTHRGIGRKVAVRNPHDGAAYVLRWLELRGEEARAEAREIANRPPNWASDPHDPYQPRPRPNLLR